MNRPDNDDYLDSLLDSLSDDQEIDKKMNDFARNKERIERIQRARENSEQFQQTYSSAARQNAPVSQAQPGIDVYSGQDAAYDDDPADAVPVGDDGAGMTRRFGDGPIAPAQNPGGSTRVFPGAPAAAAAQQVEEDPYVDQTRDMRMSSDEIDDLLEEDEPILRREYVRDDDEDDYDDYEPYDQYASRRKSPARYDDRYDDRPVHRSPKKKKGGSSWRVAAIVGGIVAAVALVGTGAYMITNFINSPSSSQTSKGFDNLLAWAQKYGVFDPENAKDITKYKSIYDKLSEDEKRKINEALLSQTGKTFDELLALADTKDKPSASNDDMENAEKKAALREQIEALSGEINKLQGELDEANRKINEAKNDYDSKSNTLDAANNELVAAQNTRDNAQAQLNALPTEESLKAELNTLHAKLSETDDDDDNVNVDEIRAAIAECERQLALHTTLSSQIQEAESKIAEAEDAVSKAQSEKDTAYGAWQAIAGNADPIQAQIDQKTAERTRLQEEYDSID